MADGIVPAAERAGNEAEEWRSIDGFPFYEVSNLGRVRSLRRIVGRLSQGVRQFVPTGGKLLKPWVRWREGKPVTEFVGLRNEAGTTTFRVHRLVLQAFIGPCPDGMEGCHNDGDPTNNRLGNLRWDTHEENLADMERHGRHVPPPTHWGEAHHNATLTFEQVTEIRSRYTGARGDLAALSREYGVADVTILRYVRGQSRLNG